MNKINNISEFVYHRNKTKKLFTAGPASLAEENIHGLMPCFGRGDDEYLSMENYVLDTLKSMSGHKKIVRLQGSASLALEIATSNFLYGEVLVISTGYYSERMLSLSNMAKKYGHVNNIDSISWKNLDSINKQYDWVVCCPTETSKGLKIDIKIIKEFSLRINSKILLDATASIGLENDHELADVIAYSSCKGLFGLTGAAFIAYNQDPEVEVDSFYLSINSHVDKKMTGPYHAVASLYYILKDHSSFREAVLINKTKFMKDMRDYLAYGDKNQPMLCTKISKEIVSKNDNVVLYKPRTNDVGSIVCHLGEIHLKKNARGEILDSLGFNE